MSTPASTSAQSAGMPAGSSQNSQPHGQMPVAISLEHVQKHYGPAVALKDVSLTINDKEFFTLLGPSGCGKTTLLRIIAGFERVTAGTVMLHGKPIVDLPANQRSVNTVFQHYSLFPHMSVADNVMFGLQMRKVPAAKARQRVADMLDMVQLQSFADRLPAQLSGGQQQRVALARALAPEPEVLLLDEPLSALDLKLRQAMRIELKQIQEEAGITFIFVTHDQEEALTLSDRIAVMSAGEVQQIGSAHDIYESPANRFVADFIGESNVLQAEVLQRDADTVMCALADGVHITAQINASESSVQPGDKGHVSIRPERLSLQDQFGSSSNVMSGRVDRHVYLGTDTHLVINLGQGQHIQLRAQNSHRLGRLPAPGDSIQLFADAADTRFLIA